MQPDEPGPACRSATANSRSVVAYPGAGPCGGMDAATEPPWTDSRRVPTPDATPRTDQPNTRNACRFRANTSVSEGACTRIGGCGRWLRHQRWLICRSFVATWPELTHCLQRHGVSRCALRLAQLSDLGSKTAHSDRGIPSLQPQACESCRRDLPQPGCAGSLNAWWFVERHGMPQLRLRDNPPTQTGTACAVPAIASTVGAGAWRCPQKMLRQCMAPMRLALRHAPIAQPHQPFVNARRPPSTRTRTVSPLM